jgi:NAD(P)H-flavin reductase
MITASAFPDFDRDKGTITLVIQAVGKTTREMQRVCREGGTIFGMVGPMGVPSHIGEAKKVVCVGGGLGVAPIYPQARGFKEAGAYVIGVVGFRSRDLIFWQDKFREVCDELIICTDDGSAGIKGLVTLGRHRRGHRHWPADHDAGLRRDDPSARDQDLRQPQPDHGRWHRHVRRLPGKGGRADKVRLRRWP